MFLMAFISNQIASDCLSSQILQSLGFSSSSIKATPEIIADPTVCKTLFLLPGTCVDQDNVKTMLQKNQDALKERVSIKSDLLEVLNDVKGSLNNDTDKEKLTQIIDQITTDTQNSCF